MVPRILLLALPLLGSGIVVTVGNDPAGAHDPSDPDAMAAPTFSDAAPASFPTPAFTTAPPTDPDVESVLVDGDRLLAGTASGVWSYDGLEWSHHAFDDTVRWIHREDAEIWAGATRGVWTADAGELDFELDADGPAGNRCRLAETDPAGANVLWAGTDEGLFRRGSGGWEHVREGARVQTLARHPSWGLLAGTWGDGLWILEPGGDWRDLRSPAPGLTDTLSGNYLHDLAVDEDGAVRMACSWGGLEQRFIAHDHVRDRGWITERDPHDFRRASLVRHDGRSWEVTYLFQNYTDVLTSEAFLIEPVFRDDIDGDGHTEWLVLLGVGRNLHPEGLASFDLETLECEWFIPLQSGTGDLRPFLRGGRQHFVFASDNSDHGAVLPFGTDHEAHLQIIGPDGSVLRRHRFDPAVRIAHPMADGDRPLDESDTLRIYERPSGEKRSPLASWTLSLETFELAPADSLWGQIGTRLLALPRGLLSRAYRYGDQTLLALRDPTVARDDNLWPEERVIEAFGQRPRYSLPLELPGPRPGALLSGEKELGLWDGQLLDRSPYPSPAGEREIVWAARDWHFGSWLLAVDRASTTVEVWRAHPAPAIPGHSRSPGGVPLDACPRLRSVATLPMERAGNDPHFSCRLASRVDSEGKLTGWIEARNESGSLPVLDPDGHRIDGLPLPAGLADARNLRWLTGEPAALGAKNVPALVDRGRIPFSIHLLDREHLAWRGPLRFDLPFRDLHANGVTALDPAGRVIGTDTGLRRAERESPPQGPWPAGSDRRVRGIGRTAEGRRLVWGSLGVGLLESPDLAPVGPALDLMEWDDELWLLGPRGARHRGRDGRWETLTKTDLPDELGERSRLLPGPDGVWAQLHWPRKVVWSPQPLVGPKGPWVSTRSPLYVQGIERTCSSILALDEQRWLATSEWGLTLVTDPRSQTVRRRDLLPDNTACTATIRVGSQILVARADGRIHELELPDAEELRSSSRSRPRARAVLEMRAQGRIVWARTLQALEKWDLDDPSADRRWELPDTVSTLAMDVSSTGGPWLGTSDGVWRLTEGETLLTSISLEGVDGHPVARIWEIGPDGRRSLALLSEGQAWELDLQRDRAEARYRILDEQVRVALWDGGPRPGPRHGILRASSASADHATASLGEDGIARFDLPSLGRGRHTITLRPLDELGREVRPALHATLRVRVASPVADLLTVLLPVPLLAIWVFLARRRLWLGMLAVLVAAAVPLTLHFGLMFEVPWATSGGVSLSLVITGLVLLGRDRRADLPPDEAIHRLSLLLAAFRHRGRGVSPVHRLLIVARNLENLVEAGDDVVTETEGILGEVLEATDRMESELPALIAHSGLRSPLLRRLQRRLEELRETASELLADRRRLLQWCADRDERLATQELCHTFVRSVGMASQLIRRHESTDLRELLREFCKTSELRGSIELELNGEVGEVPIPASGLSEILENLEANAVRANGGVAPRLRIEVGQSSGGDLQLVFEDDGPGLSVGDRQRIFELGVSGTGSHGTGLHRCRTLAAGWGGTLRCEDPRALGGARFVLEVPLRGGE